MARGTMNKLTPLIANLTPPQDSKPAGFTPDGKHQLWKLTRPMVVRKEAILDKNGDPEWLRNPNGDRVVQRFRPIIEETTETFYLEAGLNNEVQKVVYVAPTAEQLKAEERAARIKALGGGALAEALVDAGLTPEQVVAALKGGASVQAGEERFSDAQLQELRDEGVVVDEEIGELEHRGGPHWTLGNGEKFTGSKEDALLAQAELIEKAAAKATINATPSF